MSQPQNIVPEEKLQSWILEALETLAKPSSAREVLHWLMDYEKIWSTIGMENKIYSLLRRMEDRGMVVSEGWKGAKKADYIWCRKFSPGSILDRLAKDV